MKLGTETGSVMNHLYAGSVGAPEPVVGMGATILHWTDREAGTIIKVTRCQVHVQVDLAVRADTNGMSESQRYYYSPDPEGRVYVFRKTKNGWRADGHGLRIGYRQKYHDYTF